MAIRRQGLMKNRSRKTPSKKLRTSSPAPTAVHVPAPPITPLQTINPGGDKGTKYYDFATAVKFLGLKPSEVNQAILDRRLYGHRDGNDWKFKVDDVHRHAADNGAKFVVSHPVYKERVGAGDTHERAAHAAHLHIFADHPVFQESIAKGMSPEQAILAADDDMMAHAREMAEKFNQSKQPATQNPELPSGMTGVENPEDEPNERVDASRKRLFGMTNFPPGMKLANEEDRDIRRFMGWPDELQASKGHNQVRQQGTSPFFRRKASVVSPENSIYDLSQLGGRATHNDIIFHSPHLFGGTTDLWKALGNGAIRVSQAVARDSSPHKEAYIQLNRHARAPNEIVDLIDAGVLPNVNHYTVDLEDRLDKDGNRRAKFGSFDKVPQDRLRELQDWSELYDTPTAEPVSETPSVVRLPSGETTAPEDYQRIIAEFHKASKKAVGYSNLPPGMAIGLDEETSLVSMHSKAPQPLSDADQRRLKYPYSGYTKTITPDTVGGEPISKSSQGVGPQDLELSDRKSPQYAEEIIEKARPDMTKAAQEELDQWQPDEEGLDDTLGGGGPCDQIARALGDVLAGHGFSLVDGGQDGDDHAYLIAHNGHHAFTVDIPPGVYESGGGYSWKKHADVQIEPEHIEVDPFPIELIPEEEREEARRDWEAVHDRQERFEGMSNEDPELSTDYLALDGEEVKKSLANWLDSLSRQALEQGVHPQEVQKYRRAMQKTHERLVNVIFHNDKVLSDRDKTMQEAGGPFTAEDIPVGMSDEEQPIAYFDRFEIQLPREAVEDMTQPGPADEAVFHWAPKISRPEHATPEHLANELKEYGAWEPHELEDDEANWHRIVWQAAHEIKAQEREYPDNEEDDDDEDDWGDDGNDEEPTPLSPNGSGSALYPTHPVAADNTELLLFPSRSAENTPRLKKPAQALDAVDPHKWELPPGMLGLG